MGLANRTAEGPTATQDNAVINPAGRPSDVPSNQYAAQTKISKNIAAHYHMRARNAPLCDRKFQSEFGGELTDHGDSMTIRRQQMFQVKTGIAWSPQPMLEELFTLNVWEPRGIQTAEEWNTAGIYRNREYAASAEVAKKEALTYEIEERVSETFRDSYTIGVANMKASPDTGTITSYALASPGRDSEPRGNYPDNHLMTWAQAELSNRGIQDRTLTASLDPFASESMGRTALFTQQYGAGGAGAAAQSKGTIDGQMVGGWKVVVSALNGTQQYGGTLNTQPAALQVQATPTTGATSISLKSTGSNTVRLYRGNRLSFVAPASGTRRVSAVNARTKQPVQSLAQYTVTDEMVDVTGTGANTVNVTPPIRFGTATGATDVGDMAFRRRNCAGAPTTNDRVLVNGERTDSIQGRAMAGRTCAQTFLIAQDSTLMIYSLPYIDPNGPIKVQKMELAESKVAFCVAVDAELKEHSTFYEAWTRFGLGTVEYEAGVVATTEGY